jgi:DNA-binding MarR family transcriptional regulator
MDLVLSPAIFGSALRTKILILTTLLGETYPSQLARILKTPSSVVGMAVDRLERERLVATRRWGMERRVSLNPSTPFSGELRALLLRLAESSPEYEAAVRSLRTRPRRRGKALNPETSEQADLARELATRKR